MYGKSRTQAGWFGVIFKAVENLSLRRGGLQCLLANPILSYSEVPS